MSECNVSGRAWVFDDGSPPKIDVFEYAIEPMDFKNRSGAEWAKEHLEDEDLRDLFGLPAEGNFQVIFKGTMDACFGHDEEWGQWFNVEDSGHEAIPSGYLNILQGVDRR
jgi:hypothetical protein